ncbi:MAG: DUF1801 domain-containing protein [Verrucomicrobiota bacterium]
MDCSRARAKDPAEWLETCPEFSWPLAEQVHEWILSWEPDLTESIKWNMLCFSGNKLVCGMSACRRHLGLSFFRGTELPDPAGLFIGGENNTNIRSIRLTTLDGFNRDALRDLFHAAVELDSDPLAPPPPKVKRKPLPLPDVLKRAFAEKRNRAAAEFFRTLAPTYQREYMMWVMRIKRPETLARRLQETLTGLANGHKWAQRKLPANKATKPKPPRPKLNFFRARKPALGALR